MPDHPTVLIVVFDGLQPAQITAEQMPNLASFAAAGVTFAAHHPVFPTVTRVNVASIVTGCLPGQHGLAGNTCLCRDYNPTRVIPALEPVLRDVARATGRLLLRPTLADLLAQRGLEYIAIGTGTSGNAYLHHPNADTNANANADSDANTDTGVIGATIHPDFTLPRALQADLTARFGDWPPQTLPNTPRLAHAVRILTEYILPERRPAVAVLWSSEPDKTQHEDGVGLARAPQALAEADYHFGELLRWLERTGRAADTDIIVLSDHGYSTISATVPLADLLLDAGFPPIEQPGGVAAAANGGSALFYINAHDANSAAAADSTTTNTAAAAADSAAVDSASTVAPRLAAWLMAQDWCGSLFASERVGSPPDGVLPAALIGCEGPRSPDLIMSFRWHDAPNAAGYPGHAPAAGGSPGQGQHGSLSRHELRNTGLARGPSFRQSAVIKTPTGNIDIAPTILHLLGIPHPAPGMDGRILRAALASADDSDAGGDGRPAPRPRQHRAASGNYRQELQVSQVGGSRYIDWGNRV